MQSQAHEAFTGSALIIQGREGVGGGGPRGVAGASGWMHRGRPRAQGAGTPAAPPRQVTTLVLLVIGPAGLRSNPGR